MKVYAFGIRNNYLLPFVLISLSVSFWGWLKVARNSFQNFPRRISVDAKLIVPKHCPVIGEHVAVKFVAQQVTMATI